MSSNVSAVSGMLDKVKLGLSLVIAIAALAAFYFYADHSLLYRIIGLLVAAGISIAIALQTEKGRHILEYFHDTQIEVRKVVWPTRQETVNMTVLVVAMAVLVAIILWLLDMFLGWSIGTLMGHRG